MGISYLIKALKLRFCSKKNMERQTEKMHFFLDAAGTLTRQVIGFRITKKNKMTTLFKLFNYKQDLWQPLIPNIDHTNLLTTPQNDLISFLSAEVREKILDKVWI